MDQILLEDCLESGTLFCNNPECELHVRVGSPGVHGIGNWAVLENGHTFGRGRYGNIFLCDACGLRQVRELAVIQSAAR